MRAISLINQKGGVGKTTTTVNLAAALGLQDRSVLMLDLDPQGNASKWLGVEAADPGLLEVFTENVGLNEIVIESEHTNVYVAPGSLSLSGAERKLAGEVGTEFILRSAFKKIAGYDYVLIDCPPSLGLLTVNALTAGNEVIIPVVPQILSLDGIEMLFHTVNVVRDRLNPDLEVTGILPVRVDRRTKLTQQILDQLHETYGEQVLKTVIRENVRLAEAPGRHKPITSYDKRSKGAHDYTALAEEIITQEKQQRQRASA